MVRMNEQPSHIRAAIAIGSQTIRLVVARSAPSDLDIVASREEVAPIGESVTATGAISPEKANAAIAVLKRYKALVRRPKADLILVVATAALRQHWDALQARDFKRQVLDALER
jgi:exopolyphosphatase/pppGpp-phosphohydrolase